MKIKKLNNKRRYLLTLALICLFIINVQVHAVSISDFEVEPNDDVNNANEIVLGSSYNGKANKDGDIDRFVFAAPDNGNNICKLLLFKQPGDSTKYGYWIRDFGGGYVKDFAFINDIERYEFTTTPGHAYELMIFGETQAEKFYQFMIYQ